MDKLNFVKVYNLVGKLSGATRFNKHAQLHPLVEELSKELDYALGYETREEKAYGSDLEDRLLDMEDKGVPSLLDGI